MSRIAPSISPDTAFFWEGVTAHRLLIQRCQGCGELRHPPRPMCPRCNSLDWDTVESTGRGQVYSFVLPRHPRYPGYDDPHIVVLVELDEGVRLVSNLGAVDPDDVVIGMPVEVFYETFGDGLVLPQFRPAEPA
jgi:hypothetical protein